MIGHNPSKKFYISVLLVYGIKNVRKFDSNQAISSKASYSHAFNSRKTFNPLYLSYKIFIRIMVGITR